MASHHLLNYLRTYRKRSALSQEEVAFLLGTQSGAKVCRHERFMREPGLETALAYEAIFQRSVSELFPGLYQKIQMQVKARAKSLGYKRFAGGTSSLTNRKRQTLAAIAASEPKNKLKQS